MDWLINLLSELAPLYLIAVIGYITGKAFKIDTKSITSITIFVISPIVFVLSISKLDFTAGAIFAPLIIYVIGAILAAIILAFSKLYMNDKTPYLTALGVSTNNWGYFGVPIAFALFPPEMVAAYIVTGVAFQCFENSFGIYYISRGHQSPWESFLNVFRYPVIYAILAGVVMSAINFELPSYGEKFLDLFKGAYTVLGMMIIGLGLASLERFRIDWAYISTMFVVRFMIWPALAIAIIWADQQIGLIGALYYKPILLFSIMPMGANNIAFAAQFDMNPGKASIGVLFTTIFALIYIPVAIKVLGI